MPRPRIYEEERVATAIRLPTSLHDDLKRIANTRDVSVNFLIIRAVSDLLERVEDVDPLSMTPRA